MILYHTTLKRNLDSIRKHGLNPEFALNRKNPRIWIVTRSKRLWSILHVQKRHEVTLDEIAVITVSIPRSKLKRRWRGIWTTDSVIPPNAFLSFTDGKVFGESPIKGWTLDG